MNKKYMLNVWAALLVPVAIAIAQPLPWENQEAGWEREAKPAARQMEPPEIQALRAKAESGEVEAMLDLVIHYGAGGTVPVNNTAAMNWLRQAVATGNGEAQGLMGLVYQTGRLGVTIDLQEAARWFQLAADQGEVEAQAELGMQYIEGAGVPQDFHRGYPLLLQAANNGHGTAMTLLGMHFLQGEGGFSQDARQAEYWLQRAIEAGCLQAPVLLGSAFFSGECEGLAQDWGRAYRILSPMAERGVAVAQFLVGLQYATGEMGVAQNVPNAIRLWTLAAQQGDADSAFELGRTHEQGLGVPANRDLALHWYREAHAQGMAAAGERIRVLEGP